MVQNITVAGAGTMGSGIALVAAQYNYRVVLFDTNGMVLEKARQTITNNLAALVEKNKISPADKERISGNLIFSQHLHECKAELVIEAIIEQEEAKTTLFNQLADINSPSTIFATNTSSLSVSAIQKRVIHPARVAGMHFFNPAQIMKLVEVVKGEQTTHEVAQIIIDVCKTMKKTPVLCKDAPGFIVNRVARHYYLEAMHLVELKVATVEEVDELMEASGFKMGPFRLMDLIGMDVNLAVSRSLYEASGHEPRFKPSSMQEGKVERGELGRKTGKGFYEY